MIRAKSVELLRGVTVFFGTVKTLFLYWYAPLHDCFELYCVY
jgi:hypothetical protein